MPNDGDDEFFNDLIRRIDAERERRGKEEPISDFERLQLDVSKALLIFQRADHQKVETMWAWFRPFAVLAGAAALAVIGGLVSGHINVAIIP